MYEETGEHSPPAKKRLLAEEDCTEVNAAQAYSQPFTSHKNFLYDQCKNVVKIQTGLRPRTDTHRLGQCFVIVTLDNNYFSLSSLLGHDLRIILLLFISCQTQKRENSGDHQERKEYAEPVSCPF